MIILGSLKIRLIRKPYINKEKQSFKIESPCLRSFFEKVSLLSEERNNLENLISKPTIKKY